VLRGEEVPTEIVIVDQSDKLHPILPSLIFDRHCEIRYFWSQTVGVGRARNIALSEARHDLLILTDDDMFMESTWFGSLVRALCKAGPRTVVTGMVLQADGETTNGFAPSIKANQMRAIYKGRINQDVLYTGNMAMYRSVIDDIGLFDERLGAGARFPAAYDNDFGYRLLEAGYHILYAPESTVFHRAWRPDRDYARLRWNYGRGQGAFYAKHLSLRDTYMLRRMIWDVVRRSIWLLLYLIRGHLQLAYGEFRYIHGTFSGASEWLRTQE